MTDEEVVKESADRTRAKMLKWVQDARAAKARLMGDPTLYAKPAEPKHSDTTNDGRLPVFASDTYVGLFRTTPWSTEHVAAEIASWDAEPTPLPTKCEWWDTGGEGTDRCESGKPATYITCEFTPPARVCEDHKCRCKQPPQPITPSAVDPRDARIAALEEKLVAADVYGVELARRIGERDAKISGLASERIHLLDQRDQQRARADAAEARCGELESRDAPWHPFPRGTWSGVTDAKEKSK